MCNHYTTPARHFDDRSYLSRMRFGVGPSPPGSSSFPAPSLRRAPTCAGGVGGPIESASGHSERGSWGHGRARGARRRRVHRTRLRGLARRGPQPDRRQRGPGVRLLRGGHLRAHRALLGLTVRLQPAPARPPGSCSRARRTSASAARRSTRRTTTPPACWGRTRPGLTSSCSAPAEWDAANRFAARQRTARDHRGQRWTGSPQRGLDMEPRQRARPARAAAAIGLAPRRRVVRRTSRTYRVRRLQPAGYSAEDYRRDVNAFLSLRAQARAPFHLHRARVLLHHRCRDARS